MAKSKSPEKKRNRSAEARAKGRSLIAVEVGPDCVSQIDTVAAGLPGMIGVSRVTKSQAVEWLVLQGFTEFQKKFANGLEKD